jgi:hypothetical protein
MSPGDLLQWLSIAQKTGTLTFSGRALEKRVYFRSGRIISSASSDPREYLGQFLVSYGFITEEELKKAMEVQRQSKILLGKILVMINAVQESDLLRLMRLKVEEELYDIFLWQEGDFGFVDDDLPSYEMVPLQVDITGIIMEGHRRLDEWGRIRELVSDKRKVPVVEKQIDTSPLPEPQKLIIQAINGHRSIEELMLESRSSEFNVSKVIHDFARAGHLRLVEPAPPPVPQEKPFPDIFDEELDEVTALLVRAQNALRNGDYDKGLRVLKAAQNLDPNNPKVKNAMKGAETVIMSELKKSGIIESKIPILAKPLEELSNLNFSPNEGFILSRINGMWDIGSIMKISPMRETDAMLIFHRLTTDGIVTLK